MRAWQFSIKKLKQGHRARRTGAYMTEALSHKPSNRLQFFQQDFHLLTDLKRQLPWCWNTTMSEATHGPRHPSFLLKSQIVGLSVLPCCIIVCVTGNVLVLLSLKRYQNLRSPANVILGSLAISDLLMSLPMFIRMYSLSVKDFKGVHADIEAGISTTLIATASLHIALISIDRFISIRYALRYISIVTMTRVLKALVLLWSAAVIVVGLVLLLTASLAPHSDAKRILFYRKPQMTGTDEYDFQPWVICYKSAVILIFSILPLIIMIASYVYISKIAYVKRKRIRSELVRSATVNAKCTKTLFIVVFLYTFLNAPYTFMSVIQISDGNPNRRMHLVSTILLQLASTASCCNPYIYAYRDRHFKQAFKKILGCK